MHGQKVGQRSTTKPADKTTSMRLSSIANRQLEELCEFTGESATRVIIRALGVCYDKYLINSQKLMIKKSKK